MGHLKRIGKHECCDECTEGKCDECGPTCEIFATISIQGTNVPFFGFSPICEISTAFCDYNFASGGNPDCSGVEDSPPAECADRPLILYRRMDVHSAGKLVIDIQEYSTGCNLRPACLQRSKHGQEAAESGHFAIFCPPGEPCLQLEDLVTEISELESESCSRLFGESASHDCFNRHVEYTEGGKVIGQSRHNPSSSEDDVTVWGSRWHFNFSELEFKTRVSDAVADCDGGSLVTNNLSPTPGIGWRSPHAFALSPRISMFPSPLSSASLTATHAWATERSSSWLFDGESARLCMDFSPGSTFPDREVSADWQRNIALSEPHGPMLSIIANACDVEPCDPGVDEGCEECADGNGEKYTPGSCTIPDHDKPWGEVTSGALPRKDGSYVNPFVSGRAAQFAISLKGLEPGETYKCTVVFARCLSAAGPDCEIPTEYVREIEFEAEAWAEVISWDCEECRTSRQVELLEEYADGWNTANPAEEERSVHCVADPEFTEFPLWLGEITSIKSCSVSKL